MCIVFLAYRYFENVPFAILNNRDEDRDRKTEELHEWEGFPIIAGRDLEKGGSWFALNKVTKRFIVLTNYQEAGNKTKLSRGKIITDFLASGEDISHFILNLQETKEEYQGFNIICGDLSGFQHNTEEIWYYSNRKDGKERLQPGKVYGMSNELLDSPWPKVTMGKKLLTSWQDLPSSDPSFDPSLFFYSVMNYSPYHPPPRDNNNNNNNDKNIKNNEDNDQPIYKKGDEQMDRKEYLRSSIFIYGENYGTRTSTLLFILKESNEILFQERTYLPNNPKSFTDIHFSTPL